MKRYCQYSIIFLILTTCSNNVYCQQSKIGNWIGYFGNQKISKKWNFHNEIQYRNYNLLGDINQILIRAGVGYDLSKNNNNLLLGYAFVQSQSYEIPPKKKQSTDENRLFQQFLHRNRFKKNYFAHRIRLEERFIGDLFKCRLRYLISLNRPINKKELIKRAIYLSSSNEIFLNDRGDTFDRNRLAIGMGYVINQYTRIETGFMIQFLPGNNQKQIQLSLINNVPFSKIF